MNAMDLVGETDVDKLISLIEERLKADLALQGTPWEKAHVAASAFAAGGSRQAQIESPVASYSVDTHQNHVGNHLRYQRMVWEWVSNVFRIFKKTPYKAGSLFDVTTFMVISEFGRTPGLNAAKGKDHNPFTNSALLAGKGINGGKVIGASKLIPRSLTGKPLSRHIAWPFDYKTGQLATGPEGASFLFPENVIRTVGRLFSDPESFAPVPASTPIIPGVLKS